MEDPKKYVETNKVLEEVDIPFRLVERGQQN